MISNDNQQYVTVELFNSKMETLLTQIRLDNEKLRGELRQEFQAGISTLQAEIKAVDTKAQINSAKIEYLQHTFYWGFAIMTLVLTFVTVFIPYLRERKNEKQEDKQSLITEQRVQELIDQALAKRNVSASAIGK